MNCLFFAFFNWSQTPRALRSKYIVGLRSSPSETKLGRTNPNGFILLFPRRMESYNILINNKHTMSKSINWISHKNIHKTRMIINHLYTIDFDDVSIYNIHWQNRTSRQIWFLDPSIWKTPSSIRYKIHSWFDIFASYIVPNNYSNEILFRCTSLTCLVFLLADGFTATLWPLSLVYFIASIGPISIISSCSIDLKFKNFFMSWYLRLLLYYVLVTNHQASQIGFQLGSILDFFIEWQRVFARCMFVLLCYFYFFIVV